MLVSHTAAVTRLCASAPPYVQAFFVVRSQLWFELFDIASDKGSKRQTTASQRPPNS